MVANSVSEAKIKALAEKKRRTKYEYKIIESEYNINIVIFDSTIENNT